MSRSSFKNASKDELCLILKHVGIDNPERCCKGDVREFITKNFNLYKPHNNGGRPFEVFVSKDMIVAFEIRLDDNENTWYDYTKPVFTLDGYDKIWLGEDFKTTLDDWVTFKPGNSMLIKKGKDYYIFAHSDIIKFQTKNNEKVIRFGSPIFGSDVPAPFVIGEKYTYFPLETALMAPNVKGIDLPVAGENWKHYSKNQVPLITELIHRNDI